MPSKAAPTRASPSYNPLRRSSAWVPPSYDPLRRPSAWCPPSYDPLRCPQHEVFLAMTLCSAPSIRSFQLWPSNVTPAWGPPSYDPLQCPQHEVLPAMTLYGAPSMRSSQLWPSTTPPVWGPPSYDLTVAVVAGTVECRYHSSVHQVDTFYQSTEFCCLNFDVSKSYINMVGDRGLGYLVC